MIELIQDNPYLISINIVMLVAIWYTMRPAIYYADSTVSSRRLYFALFMWFLFDVFAFWGSDWFHLYVAYKDIQVENLIVEDVYTWIAHNLAPNNYILFRIIVWGAAQFFLWDTFRRISISSHLLLAVFLSVWLIWFSYARVSLAMAMAFWGLTIYHKSHGISIIPKIIGLCAIAASFYFHKSAIFIIFVSLLTILTSKVNKITFIICLIAFPLFAYILNDGVVDSVLLTMTDKTEDLDNYITKAQYYMESDEIDKGIGPLIGLLLERIPYYLIIVLGGIALFSTNNNTSPINNEESLDAPVDNDEIVFTIPEDIKVFIRALLYIVLFSSLFLFNSSVNTQIIYNRFIRFSFVPATIILAYLLENNKYMRYGWWTYCIALFGTCYQMIYMLYCSIANS